VGNFSPKTAAIRSLYTTKPKAVNEITKLLSGESRVYIDYANVRPWSQKLGWHIDPKRLKQFLDSFDAVKEVSIYQGTLVGDVKSEAEVKELHRLKYRVRTKDVKIMRLSIDATSVPDDSTTLIRQFVRRALLRQFDLQTVEYINGKLYEMNKRGLRYIEDRKCNFDVEIGVDMLLDAHKTKAQVFCLWSGDSDFTDSVSQLLGQGKKVILFATTRRVSKELSAMASQGLIIFDIAKIRNYICWKKEIK